MSTALADAARAFDAREVRVIATGVEVPAEVDQPDEPPRVLFVGRLSEEKGFLDFVEATRRNPAR